MTLIRMGLGAGRWHRIYYLLALFDVLAVAGGLWMNHRLNGMFQASVAHNKEWTLRFDEYATLDTLASRVRAPGDEIFAHTDVTEEQISGSERAFASAAATFDQARQRIDQDARQRITGAQQRLVLEDLHAIDDHYRAVIAETRRTFDQFRRNQPSLARAHNVQMERRALDLNLAITKLQRDAMSIKAMRLDEQMRIANAERWYEGILAVAMLLMVAGATTYGYNISRRIRADAAERERLIADLRASEARLEQRVNERTSALAETAMQLRQSEERFQYAARATSDALWDWDVAAGSVWWNEGFQTLFAHPKPKPTREFWLSLVHPDDAARIDASVHAFLQSGRESWNGEYRFKRSDGSFAWVLDRGFAIRDEAGAAVRMIGSMMDITERKQAERMKSDFVSFVSHQLRTPLSGMNWMLELAADAEGLPAGARRHIADARESAGRLATLVNDLLDIAKLESGRLSAVPEPLALSSLTQSVVGEMQLLLNDKGLDLQVICDSQARAVFADAQLLRQALTNLLSNAIKYTPRGGRIRVSLVQHNGSVTWSVRDTGVGVPRKAQARLSEKFYRADNAIMIDAEGNGLGLHLVRLIVGQAGGRIWCESEEGEGAMFAFTLPAIAAEKEAV